MEEQIIISQHTKGIVVHAKRERGCFDNERNWIILIQSVQITPTGTEIMRWVSHCMETGETFIDTRPQKWGKTTNYNFYKATEEEKQLIKNVLKKYNLRYAKILNKLIPR